MQVLYMLRILRKLCLVNKPLIPIIGNRRLVLTRVTRWVNVVAIKLVDRRVLTRPNGWMTMFGRFRWKHLPNVVLVVSPSVVQGPSGRYRSPLLRVTFPPKSVLQILDESINNINVPGVRHRKVRSRPISFTMPARYASKGLPKSAGIRATVVRRMIRAGVVLVTVCLMFRVLWTLYRRARPVRPGNGDPAFISVTMQRLVLRRTPYKTRLMKLPVFATRTCRTAVVLPSVPV